MLYTHTHTDRFCKPGRHSFQCKLIICSVAGELGQSFKGRDGKKLTFKRGLVSKGNKATSMHCTLS